MKKILPVHFIMTGGTIDSYYDTTKDTVVPHKKSIIPEYIKNLRLYIQINFSQVCMKDSREMTLKDMANVKGVIEKSKSNYFIVTHGTYTMADTARYLQKHLKKNKAVVILTGSMMPLKEFGNSDAPFNIGYSLSQAFNLEPGVYVCMNGRIFKPEEVAKLVGQGKFASIFSEK